MSENAGEPNDFSCAAIAMRLRGRMADLARELYGKENEGQSSEKQLRFGSKGSVSVEIDGDKAGTFYDHEAGSGGDALVLIKHKLGLSTKEAFAWAKKWLGVPDPEPSYKKLPKDPAEKVAFIAGETQPAIEGTPVKLYLQKRGITITPPDCIGYRPKAFGKYGAMVALARDIRGSVLALQQVYLTDDGQKAPIETVKRTNRAVPGWTKRASVRFPGKEPIILAEGVETALSLWQATGQETWACLGISNMVHAPVPDKTTVIIARDGDEPDSKADQQIRQIVFKMMQRGNKVAVAVPPQGKDFNDILVESGEEAIRQVIAQTPFCEKEPEPSATEAQSDFYADEEMALRFSMQNALILRYVNMWGKWLVWNGKCWDFDETLFVTDICRAIVRQAATELLSKPEPKITIAASVASAKTVSAIERLARADRRHASRISDWDANTWLLNTPDGAVDLTTGTMRPHDRVDYCTKMTAVSPGGDCPLWLAFLNRAFNGNEEIVAFCQRMLGYSLTGETRDHALFFLHGPGGNGKGVFLNTWYRIMDRYAVIAPIETFTVTNGDRHPTDLAMMRGARIVISQETEEGQRWAESKIKMLTGGDPVPARFMRQDFFTYQPQFKLMIAGNHRPSLRSVDEAVRRRFNLIPFTVIIPKQERDTQFPEKLKAEWPGILQWAIKGCLDWQRDGLNPPDAVRLATDAYLADEDALQKFIDEKCVVTDAGEFEEVNQLFCAWKEWCAATGEYAGPIKRFSQNMEMRRFVKIQHPKTRRACFAGLRLRNPPSNEQAPLDFNEE